MSSIILLHRTETNAGTGATLAANMPSAGKEPHAIYEPILNREWILHQPWDYARALAHPAGTCETNNRDVDGAPGADVYQIEITGYSADTPGESDVWYSNLKTYLQHKALLLNVPYIFPLRFATDSADSMNVRLTEAQWLDPNLRGIIGHCHVPNNIHWDPGALDLSRLLDPKAAEVELSDKLPNTGYAVGDVLNWTIEGVNKLNTVVSQLAVVVADIATHVNALASAQGVDAVAIAKETVAELHRRLES